MEKTEITLIDFRKHWFIFVLIGLVVFGAVLRSYHIDYPSIGYHNMKENIYLMQAYHMYHGGSLLELSMFHFGHLNNTFQTDMLPLIAWSTVLLWKLFGVDLLYPRLLMVFFSLANIPLIYWFVNLITKRKLLALISALFMTIMPLSVFFGRNIQPDIAGVTFILLYSIFLWKWINARKKSYFTLFVVFLTIGAHLKLTNLVGLVPFIFIFPYKRILSKFWSYIPEAILMGVWLSTLFIWKYLQTLTMPDPAHTAYASITTELFDGYSTGYWISAKQTLTNFLVDNFTWWFVGIAGFGLIFAFFKYKTTIGRYLIGCVVAAILYFTVLPGFIVRHNYYQAPFLPMVVIASAYFIYILGTTNPLKDNYKIVTVLLATGLFVLISWGSITNSIDRQFDTQFIGTDIAGNYLNEHALPSERVFMGVDPSGQTLATLWYAKRYGHWLPENVSEFRRWEDEKNFSWIFLYGGALARLPPDIWEYVEENYGVAQAGVIVNDQGPVPQYIILKKGSRFNATEFDGKPLTQITEYEFSWGNLPFYMVEK